MGVKIFELVNKKKISLADLRGKKVAIDASLFLYQFLSSIRQPDGVLFTDSKGRVTSHLMGLFSRTTKLMKLGVLPCFVFDGKPPELKREEQKRRTEVKREAERKYVTAQQDDDVEAMKKFASRTSKLTKDMIDDAKQVIVALGLPIIQAPSEGEAQASFMCKQGDVFAVATQDADTLLFGTKILLRNLAITGRKKKASALAYTTIQPELIYLTDVLSSLRITQDQLIVLALLVGTDYNRKGIKGIGPKKALVLVRKHNNFDDVFKEAKWDESYDVSWKVLFDIIKNMPVTKEYVLEWKPIDGKKLKDVLVTEHEFREERVDKVIKELSKQNEARKQKGLGAWT
jgi:flap endonuclease-1